jgi:hypothetical protein
MKIKIKFYDSFSYLLIMIKRGEFVGDTPNSLYHFGCTRLGAAKTVELYEFPLEKLPALMNMLEKAEAEGRVSWRADKALYILDSTEKERFQKTLTKAREMGASIPKWNCDSGHYNAYWNTPAMREFLGDSVTYANPI